MINVKVARIYLTESSPFLHELFQLLFDKGMKGATMFRGIKGFGPHKLIREAHVLEMHSTLPIVLEFYDEGARVDALIATIKDKVAAGCIISWDAQMQ